MFSPYKFISLSTLVFLFCSTSSSVVNANILSNLKGYSISVDLPVLILVCTKNYAPRKGQEVCPNSSIIRGGLEVFITGDKALYFYDTKGNNSVGIELPLKGGSKTKVFNFSSSKETWKLSVRASEKKITFKSNLKQAKTNGDNTEINYNAVLHLNGKSCRVDVKQAKIKGKNNDQFKTYIKSKSFLETKKHSTCRIKKGR